MGETNKVETFLCEVIDIYENGREEFQITCYESLNVLDGTPTKVLLDRMIRKLLIKVMTYNLTAEKEGVNYRQRLFADDGYVFEVTYYPRYWTVEVKPGAYPSRFKNRKWVIKW